MPLFPHHAFRQTALLSGIILFLSACGSNPKPVEPPPVNPPSTSLFSTPVNLSDSSTDSEGPLLAFDASGHASVAWLETVAASGGVAPHEELYTKTSSDNGTTFSGGESIWPGHQVADPKMVMKGSSELSYTWISPVNESSGEVFFYRSSLKSPVLLSTIETTPLSAGSPDISQDEKRAFVVWNEGSSGSRKIYARQTPDGGNTFFPNLQSNPKTISATPDSEGPLTAAEGSAAANMVWVERNSGSGGAVLFSRTEDGGGSFTTPVSLSSEGGEADCPQIGVAQDGRLFVAWMATSGGNTDLYLTSSSDRNLFTTPITAGRTGASCPRMAVGQSGGASLVWEEGGEIWFARSSQGTRFLAPANLSRSPGVSSGSPRITLDGTAINVVWVEDSGGNGEIYFSGSRNGGFTFSEPLNLSGSAADSTSPVIGADGLGHVYVAWAEGPAGAREIYFRKGAGASGLPGVSGSFSERIRDVNGDGFSDFIVGAPGDGTGPGKAHLFYGGPDLSDTAAQSFAGGLPGDRFGTSVAMGDLNGDGLADLMIGAPEAGNQRGMVSIFFGGSGLNPALPDVTLSGAQEGDRLGAALASAGDINGDGIEDLILGVPSGGSAGYTGKVYLFLGGPYLSGKSDYPDLSVADTDGTLTGTHLSRFGASLDAAGDVNGDGYGDFVVGAPGKDGFRGGVYLFTGGKTVPTAATQAFSGNANGDWLGRTVAGVGDLNRDGYGDFVAGNRNEEVSVFFGGKTIAASPGLILNSPVSTFTDFGLTIAGGGDVNGDGFDDLVVAAPLAADGNRINAGKVFLYLGDSSMDGTADRIYVGEQAYDLFGKGAARIVGDADGDGLDDAAVGAALGDDPEAASGADQGRVYLFPGSQVLGQAATPDEASEIPTDSATRIWSGVDSGDHFGGALWRIR